MVVMRLRSQTDLAGSLAAIADVLGARSGCLWVEAGRNLDEPDLWMVASRWADVGSYRRALSDHEVKMALQPVMGCILDEPSAYEGGAGQTGDVWNRNIPR